MGRYKPGKPRRPRRTASLVEQDLRALVGEEITGGCDHCHAVQRMREDIEHPGIFVLGVHHEDGCPWYARRSKRKLHTPR
ncbi:hypothetical protein [Streptomyces fungicidicus]